MSWREASLSGDLVKWDEAKTVEGAYMGSEVRSTQFGENSIHFVDTNEGRVAFFGTMQIDAALKQASVGQLVQIEYTGRKTKTPKGQLKEFVVRMWEAEGA